MKLSDWLIAAACCLHVLVACSNDDNDLGTEGVALSAPEITEITSDGGRLTATLALQDGIRYTATGFCYNTEGTPDQYDATVKATVSGNSFTTKLSGLTIHTTYHVRAFAAVYGGKVTYSPEVTFTTDEGSLNQQLAAYTAPTYPDDYVGAGITDWTARNKWNLANVHDPTVMRAADGYYYMYQTDASWGNVHAGHGHFHARRSKDLVNWEYLGGTMAGLPEWVAPKLNEIRKAMGLPALEVGEDDFGYWAPVVRKVNDNLYRMYYSLVCLKHIDGDGTWGERAFIGLMETTDPASNVWEDKGFVLTNPSDRGLNFRVPANDWSNAYYAYNAIAPSYLITPEGQHWLVYGSWHSGIAAVELDAATGKLKSEPGLPWADNKVPEGYGTPIYTRTAGNRWQASEGPEVVWHNGWYYLFLAYDALDVPYNTRVVRAKSITGPYYNILGEDVTRGGDALPVVTHPYKFTGSDGWVGISHCAIFTDGDDHWFYASQGRLPKEVNNANMLGHIRSIRWTADGWPLVMPERYGAVPQAPITEAEIAGTWEHIDLSYKYGVQKESQPMEFRADHTIGSGPWQGAKWSFDASRQVIQVDNGTDLYLCRETDWEAKPRTHTLIYAAYSNTGKTYWGKKSK